MAARTSRIKTETQKKRIIRSLFAFRWLRKREGADFSPIVTLDDVQQAITRAQERWKNNGVTPLSKRNPANFFKDIVRRESTYRNAWPWSAIKRGFIGIQAKGRSRPKETPKGESPCFKFVEFNSSDPIGDLYQQVPTYNRPRSTDEARIFDIQTLELPVEVRRLRREDETFILQLIVRLRVIETHLGIVSKKGFESLVHLQMGLKLRNAEIDALFLGVLQSEKTRPVELSNNQRVLVALEAKGNTDDILKSQIEDQAIALFALDAFKEEVDFVVPMAAKLVAQSRLYVAEYEFIGRDALANRSPELSTLRLASEAFYDLSPAIGGPC